MSGPQKGPSPAVAAMLAALNAKCIQCVQAARYKDDSPEDAVKYEQAWLDYQEAHERYMEACGAPPPWE